MLRRPLVLLACLFWPITLPAADDCTFDQAHQIKVMTKVAQQLPGARFNRDGGKVVTGGPADSTEFSYGGCVDFGSVVTRATARAKPRSRAQVFAVAKQLAKRYWDNDAVRAHDAARALRDGLDAKSTAVTVQDTATTYTIADPTHLQLLVMHTVERGIDRVTIVWQGLY